MSPPLPAQPLPRSPKELIAPSREDWARLSPSQRERLLSDCCAHLSAQAELAPEGRPHARARNRTLDVLSQYFSRIRHRIYLADDMPVLSPGEPVFSPDILAVLDVEDPGEADTRMAWVVADEGKGLDLALEIYLQGDEQKDFVDNVERYARLGIAEHFIYDRRRQRLTGYRLPGPEARRYQPIRQHFGRYESQVLGLELLASEGRLRFFHGSAELFDSGELIGQMGRMVEELERRQIEADRRAALLEDQLREEQRRREEADAGVRELEERLRQLEAGEGDGLP